MSAIKSILIKIFCSLCSYYIKEGENPTLPFSFQMGGGGGGRGVEARLVCDAGLLGKLNFSNYITDIGNSLLDHDHSCYHAIQTMSEC